jgi:hypothetical protein
MEEEEVIVAGMLEGSDTVSEMEIETKKKRKRLKHRKRR